MAARPESQKIDQRLAGQQQPQQGSLARGRWSKPPQISAQARPLRRAGARADSEASPSGGQLRGQAAAQVTNVNALQALQVQLQTVPHAKQGTAQAMQPRLLAAHKLACFACLVPVQQPVSEEQRLPLIAAMSFPEELDEACSPLLHCDAL